MNRSTLVSPRSQPPLQQPQAADDDGEHVVEVVGDAAGQLADGLDLLHLANLALRLFTIANFGLEVLIGRYQLTRAFVHTLLECRVDLAQPSFGGIAHGVVAQRQHGSNVGAVRCGHRPRAPDGEHLGPIRTPDPPALIHDRFVFQDRTGKGQLLRWIGTSILGEQPVAFAVLVRRHVEPRHAVNAGSRFVDE